MVSNPQNKCLSLQIYTNMTQSKGSILFTNATTHRKMSPTHKEWLLIHSNKLRLCNCAKSRNSNSENRDIVTACWNSVKLVYSLKTKSNYSLGKRRRISQRPFDCLHKLDYHYLKITANSLKYFRQKSNSLFIKHYPAKDSLINWFLSIFYGTNFPNSSAVA